MDPIFRLEDSKFRAINDINQFSSGNVIEIQFTNMQKELNGENGDENCNYDYKGKLVLARNDFGYLGMKDVFAEGAGQVQIINNTFQVLNEFSFDLRQVKSAIFKGNNFGFVVKPPFAVLDYDKYVGSNCDAPDLAQEDINVNFTFNVFANFKKDYIRVDDNDKDFSPDFVTDRFEILNNGLMKPCTCDFEFENFDIEDNFGEAFAKELLETSLCHTTHYPPIFGKMADVCNGTMPKDSHELEKLKNDAIELLKMEHKNATDYLKMEEEKKKKDEKKVLKGQWATGLVAGLFFTVVITVLVTIGAMKFCKK